MKPLAQRMRPHTFEEVVGLPTALVNGAPLRQSVLEGRLPSLIFWGPPGCGKTTIAKLLVKEAGYQSVTLSAVLDGVKALRAALDRPPLLKTGPLVLFVDEIHRWNKAQQDALLPFVESGEVILLGATTENPAYEINPALRSRVQIIALQPPTQAEVLHVLERALVEERGLQGSLQISAEALSALALSSAGDVRRALTDLDFVAAQYRGEEPLSFEAMKKIIHRSDIRHDRDGSDHYNVLSAWIKSMRGSDAQASIYYLARLIAGGEPVSLVARRLVIFASEDVGNADPRALAVAVDAKNAAEAVGYPEARIPLAQATLWCATCPKSNAAYLAINEAIALVERTGALSVPEHLQSTSGGAHPDYRYPHDSPFGVVQQEYLPKRVRDAQLYRPTRFGEERLISERMAWWQRKLKEEG